MPPPPAKKKGLKAPTMVTQKGLNVRIKDLKGNKNAYQLCVARYLKLGR